MVDNNKTQTTIPKWIYVLTITALLSTNGIFAMWYSNALDDLNENMAVRFEQMQEQINNRFISAEQDRKTEIMAVIVRYQEDVRRFNAGNDKNGDKLDKIVDCQNDLKVKIGEIKTKQDMVLRQIGLANGYHYREDAK